MCVCVYVQERERQRGNVAADSQLLSCRGALKYITAFLRYGISEENGPERGGKSDHTNLTLLCYFHPLLSQAFSVQES